jgi:hypothetical protein
MTNPLNFYCKVWEDDQSCITMVTSQKFTPQMKHIALKYHHFKQYVESGKVQINYMHTELQQADILTKPVKIKLFPKLRYMLMGWRTLYLYIHELCLMLKDEYLVTRKCESKSI